MGTRRSRSGLEVRLGARRSRQPDQQRGGPRRRARRGLRRRAQAARRAKAGAVGRRTRRFRPSRRDAPADAARQVLRQTTRRERAVARRCALL